MLSLSFANHEDSLMCMANRAAFSTFCRGPGRRALPAEGIFIGGHEEGWRPDRRELRGTVAFTGFRIQVKTVRLRSSADNKTTHTHTLTKKM